MKYRLGKMERVNILSLILPWLVLTLLVIGIYYMFSYGLTLLVLASKPISEMLKNGVL